MDGRAGALAPLAALATVVLWASAFVGIGSAGGTLSPGALALGRLLVSALVLGALAYVRARRSPIAATWFGSEPTVCSGSASTTSC